MTRPFISASNGLRCFFQIPCVYDFFQCTRGRLFVAILLRLFRPWSRISSSETRSPLSLLGSIISHPIRTRAADELYVRTPISKYMEAFEGWATIRPRFSRTVTSGAYSGEILFSSANGCLRTRSDLMVYCYTLSTSPIPLSPQAGRRKLCVVLAPSRRQSIAIDS